MSAIPSSCYPIRSHNIVDPHRPAKLPWRLSDCSGSVSSQQGHLLDGFVPLTQRNHWWERWQICHRPKGDDSTANLP